MHTSSKMKYKQKYSKKLKVFDIVEPNRQIYLTFWIIFAYILFWKEGVSFSLNQLVKVKFINTCIWFW